MDQQEALLMQMNAILHAINAIRSLPDPDSDAIIELQGIEEGLETEFSALAVDPNLPQLPDQEIKDLQDAMDNLATQIKSSETSSLLILGAARVVGATRGVPV